MLMIKQWLLRKKGVYFATHYAKNASLYLDYISFDAIIYPKHIFYRPKKTGGKAGLMLTHSMPGIVWVSRLPTNFFRLSATFVQALANQQLRQNLHQKLEDFNESVYILYCYDLLQNTVNQR